MHESPPPLASTNPRRGLAGAGAGVSLDELAGKVFEEGRSTDQKKPPRGKKKGKAD